MKIINAEQSRSLDYATMQSEPIDSIDLMERAGMHITQRLLQDYDHSKTFVVLCGTGNNGGDGLVIARLLYKDGCNVIAYVALEDKEKSPENLKNLYRLKEIDCPVYSFNDLRYHDNAIWIDSIFGSGLSRPIEGKWKNIVDSLNTFDGDKVAIDIPSGLYADKLPANNNTLLHCDKTYTIGQPKLTFLLPETAEYVGDFTIIDIDLDQSYLQKLLSPYCYVTQNYIQKIYRPRKRISHKGTYGHAIIIGGSYGKIGAATMATSSALKAGAGLVTCCVPSCGYHIVQQSIPEAMCITTEGEKFIQKFPAIADYNAIGLGCGLGQDKGTQEAFYDWLKTQFIKEGSLVIDADGLNLLSKNKSYLNYLPHHTILTPHRKEFERLTHPAKNSVERLSLAQDFSRDYNIILVLKDAITSIIEPNGMVYFNSTGNAGLATGGSGDTLTGIITALLAQNYNALDAALLGVWLHGKSADIGLENESMESFTATDIAKYLGKAFKSIYKKVPQN